MQKQTSTEGYMNNQEFYIPEKRSRRILGGIAGFIVGGSSAGQLSAYADQDISFLICSPVSMILGGIYGAKLGFELGKYYDIKAMKKEYSLYDLKYEKKKKHKFFRNLGAGIGLLASLKFIDYSDVMILADEGLKYRHMNYLNIIIPPVLIALGYIGGKFIDKKRQKDGNPPISKKVKNFFNKLRGKENKTTEECPKHKHLHYLEETEDNISAEQKNNNISEAQKLKDKNLMDIKDLEEIKQHYKVIEENNISSRINSEEAAYIEEEIIEL